ncbi:MAG TPA: YhjD/YihY/BrkB family envelope integrity protein [Propionibacteriaceae bacterium]|nr:YhjD/YihY/BrkB family envelope integrity protein [Propionibacteriaceae bacterium]
MVNPWSWAKRTPWTAHIVRAIDRYTNRLGNQLAGGVTYFSVLTLIPVLMFAFSMLGLVLTVVRRDWLITLKDVAIEEIGTVAGGPQAVELVEAALTNWRTLLIIGLVAAAYSGSGWMSNLRAAVRAMWRPEFDFSPPGRNWLAERFVNLGYFVILMTSIVASFALTVLGGQFASRIVSRVGWSDAPLVSVLLSLFALGITLLMSFGMFAFLFTVLPQYRAPRKDLIKGSAAAGIALSVLLYLTTTLIAMFSGNLAAAVFGPVIALMLFFNIFARLTLLAAAWIATAYQPAIPRKYSEVDEPLRRRSKVITVEGHWEAADADLAAQEQAKWDARLAREKKSQEKDSGLTREQGQAQEIDEAQASSSGRPRHSKLG